MSLEDDIEVDHELAENLFRVICWHGDVEMLELMAHNCIAKPERSKALDLVITLGATNPSRMSMFQHILGHYPTKNDYIKNYGDALAVSVRYRFRDILNVS